jgi:hypothetical protein
MKRNKKSDIEKILKMRRKLQEAIMNIPDKILFGKDVKIKKR